MRACAASTQDLGARLVAKGRRALTLQQYDAARSWLDEATSIGYSVGGRGGRASAISKRRSPAEVPGERGEREASLTLVKSVQPVYPRKSGAEPGSKAGSNWISRSRKQGR